MQVIHDVDLVIEDHAVLLPPQEAGQLPVRVRQASCLAALEGAPLDSPRARARLAHWLRLRRWLADLPDAVLVAQVRPVGLPVDHVLHPGRAWVVERVLGDALDLGLGVLGLDPERPDDSIVVAPSLWRAMGLRPDRLWKPARRLLERMGELAAERWAYSGREVLRPMGGCDVVTLLGALTLRTAVTAGEAAGLRAAVVPMRTRGWTRLSRLDPAFGPAAAMATDPAERGFLRPVLITESEVVQVPAGGRAAEVCLADPLPA